MGPFVLAIRQISSTNAKVCLCAGSLLNLFLVWLVLKKTPKEMRVYSKIVLQTCIFDLLLLALSAIVEPIPFVVGGVFLVLENGALGTLLPSPLHVVAYHLWIYQSFLGIAGICVQFIYRFQTLCRMKEYGLREYLGILAVGLSTQIALLAPFCWIGYPPNGQFPVRDATVLQLMGENPTTGDDDDWRMRSVLHGDIADTRWIVWLLFAIVNNAVEYAVIVVCGWKMCVHVRRNIKMGGQKRINEINRQMTKNMIIQATLPLANICIYSTVIFASFAPQQDWLLCVTMLLGPLINWVPVLNPLVTILTVAPYRRTLVRVGQSLPSESAQNAKKQPPPKSGAVTALAAKSTFMPLPNAWT